MRNRDTEGLEQAQEVDKAVGNDTSTGCGPRRATIPSHLRLVRFLRGNVMAEKDTQRKVLAVLAGGLVLGVGIGVTLAAWNDSEFATGTFTAGSFNLEGSTTSATDGYDDHNVDLGDTAAALVFQLPAVASSMSPGDVVYAPFWVRLDSTTTNGATLVPSGITAGTGGNEANLSYTVTAIDAGDVCDATAHRITSIAPGASADERVITMRGDANAADDPYPYTVQTVRIVLFSIPGFATVIVAMGDPYVLGGLTIGATVLVVWAFWPRSRKESREQVDPAGVDR